MKVSRRAKILISGGGLLLVIGALLWPYLFNEIVSPLSVVVWIFLRLFVLSIGQVYYWSAVILVVFIFLIRLLAERQPKNLAEEIPDSNSTLLAVVFWHHLFTLTGADERDEKNLKRELAHLLVCLFASKQRTAANYGLYTALEQGEIPLPKDIHAFLFWEAQKKSGRSWNAFAQSLRTTPLTWVRRWTGQKTAEQYRRINEVLGFIETSLEVKHDDGKFAFHNH
jgi:hypothetical protein